MALYFLTKKIRMYKYLRLTVHLHIILHFLSLKMVQKRTETCSDSRLCNMYLATFNK